jgi:hypothetical protein
MVRDIEATKRREHALDRIEFISMKVNLEANLFSSLKKEKKRKEDKKKRNKKEKKKRARNAYFKGREYFSYRTFRIFLVCSISKTPFSQNTSMSSGEISPFF